jgi:hypothetical protein
MKATGPLPRIRVVLCRPSHPGNIGAAARAMKTMGLSQLWLVRPKRFPDPEARAMARGALDVLESSRVCAHLDEALAGTTLSVALSARPRELSHSSTDARAVARELSRRRGGTRRRSSSATRPSGSRTGKSCGAAASRAFRRAKRTRPSTSLKRCK